MKIIVDKDNVRIVNPPVIHKGEYGVHKCEFEFTGEYDGLIKMAVFKFEYQTYKVDVINNVCDIPSEVLAQVGDVDLGLYAFTNDNDKLTLRYSPRPDTITVIKGSYSENGKTPVQVTPSQYELYSVALNEGLNEVKGAGDYAKAVGDQLLEDKANGVFRGDKGDAGSVKFIVVNELPSENIDESAIYMVPAGASDEGNTYAEYIYVNGVWESVGSASVNVDLADYVKNTDYATGQKAGVGLSSSMFGVFRSTTNNYWQIKPASNSEIDNKTDEYKPIVPKTLDYAVKSVGDKYYATEEYVDNKIGDIESALKEV